MKKILSVFILSMVFISSLFAADLNIKELSKLNKLDIFTIDEKEYSIIVNSEEIKILSLQELRYIFSGKITHWDDGSRIKLIIRPYNDYEQKEFIGEYLWISVGTFKKNVQKLRNVKVIVSRKILNNLQISRGSLGLVSGVNMYTLIDETLIRLYIIDEEY